MYIVDANLLIYAVNSGADHHQSAARWLDRTISAGETIGVPWIVATAFVRLATHPATLERPLSPDQAIDQLRAWLDQPCVVVPEATTRHLDLFGGLLHETGSTGNLVNDAHIAALALEYGATVVTYDSDFALFGVDWTRPKAA